MLLLGDGRQRPHHHHPVLQVRGSVKGVSRARAERRMLQTESVACHTITTNSCTVAGVTSVKASRPCPCTSTRPPPTPNPSNYTPAWKTPRPTTCTAARMRPAIRRWACSASWRRPMRMPPALADEASAAACKWRTQPAQYAAKIQASFSVNPLCEFWCEHQDCSVPSQDHLSVFASVGV